MIFVGQDEVDSGVYALKNTETQEEQKLSFDDIVTTLRGQYNFRKMPISDILVQV